MNFKIGQERRLIMVQPIQNKNVPQISPKQTPLRPGQIVSGKIQKLYPGQKAQIQIGSAQLTAKLEAPLSQGVSYHFQVDQVTDAVYLRVLGEQLINREESLHQLLKQLNMKSDRLTHSFVQRLIQQQVPFDRNQLVKAIQILNEAPKKAAAGRILSEMILRRLPITSTVYEALVQVQQTGLGEQINQFSNILRRENTAHPTVTQLLSLLNQGQQDVHVQLSRQIVVENQQNKPSLFLLLKASGVIPKNIDFQTWKSNWASVMQGRTQSPSETNQREMPFQLTAGTVQKILEQTTQNKNALTANASQFIQQWKAPIQQVISTNQSLPLAQRQQITQQMIELLQPLNSSMSKQAMQLNVNTNKNDLQEILLLAHMLEGGQALKNADQLLTLIQNRKSPQEISLNPNFQFIDQVRFMLASVGLSYEHDLLHEKYESPTMKELLLQLVQEKDGTVRKQALQLLNFLNGMQLNSVEETDNFIRANLLLPGERLHIKSDVRMEFEGRKKTNGEISTDFCRIFFYLTLSSLGETIIDMNVQNRNIHVTIYNDRSINSTLIESLKPQLKTGLEQINYHFSGVTFKPIENKETLITDKHRQSIPARKGVDFRI